MSNGTAEKLHPLQNTWCLWEHKVRHESSPSGESSPFVMSPLLLAGENRRSPTAIYLNAPCAGRSRQCRYLLLLVPWLHGTVSTEGEPYGRRLSVLFGNRSIIANKDDNSPTVVARVLHASRLGTEHRAGPYGMKWPSPPASP